MKTRIVLSLLLVPAGVQAVAPSWQFACQNGEQWNLGGVVDSIWEQRFQEYKKGALENIVGFSLATELRRQAKNEEQEALAEYWLGLSLYRMKLYDTAEKSFSSLSSKGRGALSVFQEAALACLLEIVKAQPARVLPESVLAQLQNIKDQKLKTALAFRLILEGKKEANIVQAIPQESPYSLIAKTLSSLSREKWMDAVEAMNVYFSSGKGAKELLEYENSLRLTAGRLFYGVQQYEQAQQQYAQVKKTSNEIVEALGELAWTHLRRRQYGEAVGVATSMQMANLKATYAPESLLVMGISYFETCHYPEATKAVESYKKQYGPILEWLKTNKPSYAALKKAIKDPTTSGVPVKILGEWIRTQRFLSTQAEINDQLKINAKLESVLTSAQKTQKEKVKTLLTLVSSLKADLEKQSKRKESDALSTGFKTGLAQLEEEMDVYDALRRAAPVWKKITAVSKKLSEEKNKWLVKNIEDKLKLTHEQMIAQLEDVADNLYFLEIEIYQKATKDLMGVSLNGKKKVEPKRENFFKADVMSWGGVASTDLEKTEFWEDELGSLKAQLVNRCSKKEVAGL